MEYGIVIRSGCLGITGPKCSNTFVYLLGLVVLAHWRFLRDETIFEIFDFGAFVNPPS